MKLLEQYNKIKEKHPDAILMIRVGDFYELFGKDAIEFANVTGTVLTKRPEEYGITPLTGFPHYGLDVYLPKMVRAGYRVAICDQLG